MITTYDEILQAVNAEAKRRGYKFEETDDYVRLIRPDGSIALVAKKPEWAKTDRIFVD